MATVGAKMLAADGGSLAAGNRVIYPVDEWIEVGGNGAYVAVSGGLTEAGIGEILALFECQEPTGAPAPKGVVCYRKVKRLPGFEVDKISSRELLGEIAYYCDLPPAERVRLALRATPDWRGQIACYSPGLSPEDRIALAMTTTPRWRGQIAAYGVGLKPRHRLYLAHLSTPNWRGHIASHVASLPPKERLALALRSTPTWCGDIADNALGLPRAYKEFLRAMAPKESMAPKE